MAQHRRRGAATTPAARLGRLLVALITAATATLSISPVFASVAAGGGPVAATPATPGPTKAGYSKLVDNSAVLQPAPAAGAGRRTVFVQLAGPGAAHVSADLLAKGESVAQVRLAVQARLAVIAGRSAAVSAAAAA